MEYRGYDSVGIATINNGRILVKDLSNMEGQAGIGHTRWATHGSTTEKNAHLHYGCTDSMAIVHNGIIENHIELREELIDLGHDFKSDTDSKVIARLLERYYASIRNPAAWDFMNLLMY